MQANDKLKEEVVKASEANGRLLAARVTEHDSKMRQFRGPEVVNSWECLPGSNEEIFVQTVIVRDHMGLPFIGRAHLRPHELRCFNYEAGFLIAAGKAYRQMADSLTRRGLAKVRTLFAPYERARKRHDDFINMGMAALDQVSRESPSTHEERLLDALNTSRVIICDQCHKPYGSYENLISTARGNLFQCPHCKNIVPKSTLEELHKSAVVMPEASVYETVRKRIRGTLMWTEHKDGTITEDDVEELHSTWEHDPHSGACFCQSCRAIDLCIDGFSEKCPQCGAIMEAPAGPVYTESLTALADGLGIGREPPAEEGPEKHCSDCRFLGKPVDPPLGPMEDQHYCSSEAKGVVTPGFGACHLFKQREPVQGLTAEEVAEVELQEAQTDYNAAAHVLAEAICPKPEPSEAVKTYGAIVGAMAPVGMEHMPEPMERPKPCEDGEHRWKKHLGGDASKQTCGVCFSERDRDVIGPEPGLALTVGMVKTKCVQCKKELERDPADGSDLCPTCKEGGWMVVDDQRHRFSYWKDPEGLEWDLFRCLCLKHHIHPERVLVKDAAMSFDMEAVCSVCYEKYKGAK